MTAQCKEIIEKIKESRFWNLLFNKHDVLFMHVVGSNLSGLLDEESDLDIFVMCANKPQGVWEDVYRFKYKGCPVHLCYHTVSEYLFEVDLLQLSQLNGVTAKYLDPEHFLYVKPGYEKLVSLILELKEDISFYSSIHFLQSGVQFIDEWINNELKDEKSHCKWLHHLLMAGDIIHKEESEKDFLTRVKRIKLKGISPEDTDKCLMKLKRIKASMEEFLVIEASRKMKEYNRKINDCYLMLKENNL